MGRRHTVYSPEIAEEIARRLGEGESLLAICRTEGMPTEGAVRYWTETDHDGFAAKFAQARARGLEHLAEEILEIADDGSNDTYTDDEGNERTNADVVQRSKLRVDARKWVLSKLAPRTYGDRLELAGEVGVREIPDDRIQSRLADLLRAAGAIVALGGDGAAESPAEDPLLLSADGSASA